MRAEQIQKPAWTSRAASFCKKILRKLSLDNCELSVVFCNNEFIRGLNMKFRGRDEPTDILSFSQEEADGFPEKGERVLGDMVISLDMLRANCSRFCVKEEEELKRLLIHGILHLSGRDHRNTDPRQPMLILQEKILHELSEETLF